MIRGYELCCSIGRRHDCSASPTCQWPTPCAISKTPMRRLLAGQGLCVGPWTEPGPALCVSRGSASFGEECLCSTGQRPSSLHLVSMSHIKYVTVKTVFIFVFEFALSFCFWRYQPWIVWCRTVWFQAACWLPPKALHHLQWGYQVLTGACWGNCQACRALADHSAACQAF